MIALTKQYAPAAWQMGSAFTPGLRRKDLRVDKFTAESPSQQASLYRYYDEDGMLIYVGITERGVIRNHEHASFKEWWPFVASQQVEHFPTREIALANERITIQTYRPPFNKQHNIDYDVLHSIYMQAREAGEVYHPFRTLDVMQGGKRLDVKCEMVGSLGQHRDVALRPAFEDTEIVGAIRLKGSAPVYLGGSGEHIAKIKEKAKCGVLVYLRARLDYEMEVPKGDWILTVHLDTSTKPARVLIDKAVVAS
jgi:hypothetical protein